MEALLAQLIELVPLKSLNFILNVATMAILFYGIRPWLMELTTQVKETNGNVRDLKQWKDDHNDSDEGRHQENLKRFQEINDSLRDLNNHSRK